MKDLLIDALLVYVVALFAVCKVLGMCARPTPKPNTKEKK